ncbi:MAG TPA: AmmeMemoRadiSam system protein A [Steroidobacteraceae bacterium]
MTDLDLGRAVLTLARSAIAEKLALGTLEAANHPRLEQSCASFVTLRKGAELRGCVGSLQPVRTLREDVQLNAIAAAFRDPRFPPLGASELANTSIEVSLLSPGERIEAASEMELLAQLRPGVDGVTLEWRAHRATLLPQVWQHIGDPRDFLAALKVKAGLPEEFWSAEVLVSRYAVTTWKEPGSTAPPGD